MKTLQVLKQAPIKNHQADCQHVRVIKSLADLDQMLDELDAAAAISDDALRALFGRFRMEFDTQVPADPYSSAYRDQQFDLYQKIAGKAYAVDNEASIFNVENAVTRPFPYYTGSCATVGAHLLAMGHLIRSMNLSPGSSIIEFGPGWGNTTLMLAMMGFAVTAVDIEPRFCELITRRAAQNGLTVNVINADFSQLATGVEPVDAILFFECFHHCSDHLALLKNLHQATKSDGRVFFAAEPITPDFPIPWGLRLDGESLWAIRRHGWLELGFNERYFTQTLDALGWMLHKHNLAEQPWARVLEARKKAASTWRFPASDPRIQTQTGQKMPNKTIVATGVAGFLMYGPYLNLPAGRYVAKTRLGITADGVLRGSCRYEAAYNGGQTIPTMMTIDLDQIDRQAPVIALDFTLPEEQHDLEIRLWCNQSTALAIIELEIVCL